MKRRAGAGVVPPPPFISSGSPQGTQEKTDPSSTANSAILMYPARAHRHGIWCPRQAAAWSSPCAVHLPGPRRGHRLGNVYAQERIHWGLSEPLRQRARGLGRGRNRACGHFGDRRPIVYPELLGFVVHPEHAPSTALGYARIAHMSAPRVTSQVKRPAPSGMMTRRPRA
jgi:hypothetical protein